MKTVHSDSKELQACAREGCHTPPPFGEEFCSVIHRRQHELLYGWDAEDDFEDEQETEAAPEWRDENGNVDLDAVRSGNVDVRHSDAILATLLDEVEGRRADRDLVRAVLEAIDVPHPATLGDENAYHSLLASRASIVRAGLRTALEDDYNVPHMVRFIRDSAARDTVTYKTVGGAR